MKYYIRALKNYANFRGRSTRKEYWMFVLFNVLFTWLAIILDLVISSFALGAREALETIRATAGFSTGVTQIYFKYIVLMAIPSLAIVVRRMHDIGKSGWAILLSLIPIIGGIWYFILLCTDSKQEDNQYAALEEKPEKTTPQLLKINIIAAVLFWGLTEILFWVIIKAGATNETFMYMYGKMNSIYVFPKLTLDLMIWTTWMLGVLRLPQMIGKKFKVFFSAGFCTFLGSDLLYTMIVVGQNRWWQISSYLFSFLYIVVDILLLSSVVLSYLGLNNIIGQQSKHKGGFLFSFYMFMIPAAVWVIWSLFNTFFPYITFQAGATLSTAFLIFRTLLVAALIIAVIVLMQVKIKEQNLHSSVNDLIASDF